VNTEQVKDGGQTKGQEQALEVHDKPAACCQDRVVRTKNISENRDSEEESGETTKQELDDAPELNASDVLVEALKKLIRLFSLEDVKKALVVAESDI
jgi:hypothetical protein